MGTSAFTLTGNADSIRESAAAWSTFATETSSARADILRIDSGDFQGDEADTFRDKLNRDLPPHLETTSQAWSEVAGALRTYAGELEGLQSRMSSLAVQAGDQQAARDRAEDGVVAARAQDSRHAAEPSPAAAAAPAARPAVVDPYQSQLPGAATRFDAARTALQATTDAAGRLHAEHNAAVDSCVAVINRAAAGRFQEPPGFWGRLKDSVVTWVSDHADVLKAVSAVLRQISSIAGVLAMIPVLAPVMAPIAVASAAGSALIDGALKLATGQGSWTNVLVDGATMLPLGKGIALLGDARAGTTVAAGAGFTERAASGSRAAVSASSRARFEHELAGRAGGTGDVTPMRAADGHLDAVRTKTPLQRRTCVSDPIDVVSGEMILAQTDLELPGILPLVLSRVHVSSYRWGRSFGPSWASTVDQRVEIGRDGGACFIAEDGGVLYYPSATSVPAGVCVLPTEGPRRWRLGRTGGGGWTVEDPDAGIVRRFGMPDQDGVSVILEIADRNGNTISFDYDERGTSCGVRHSGGYRVDLPSVAGLIVGVVVQTDETTFPVTAFDYAGGNLVKVSDFADRALTLQYDQDARIIGWTDRNGIWYRYQYDDDGRCIRTSGRGRALSYGFSYLPGRTLVTDSLGAVSSYEYNEARQISRIVDPLGNTRTSVWDSFDRPVSRTDELGRTTAFEYDRRGDLIGVIHPDGGRELLYRNAMGLPVRMIDVDGAEWAQAYDAQGNLLCSVDPEGSVTRYTYSATGLVQTITDALGGVTAISSNPAGLPVVIVDTNGARTTYTYDSFGRLVRSVDPVGGATRLSWTVAGKLIRRIGPDGAHEEWEWDGEGNLTAHVDACGARTTIENGVFDLPIARTGPDGNCFRFGYDTELRLTSVHSPTGVHWEYVYDAAGRLIAETDFNGHQQAYGWDRAGQLTSITNGLEQITRLRYDLGGHVVERSSPDGSTAFTYDLAGRVLAARSPGATVEFVRDALGRVVIETLNGRSVRFEFDALGRCTARTTPTGVSSRWGFGVPAQPTLTCEDQSIRFSLDAAGRETDRTFSAGMRLRRTHDPAGRLIGQVMGVAAQTFSYRPDGAVASVSDDHDGSRRFDLDASGRVTRSQAVGWSESYAYDTSGKVSYANGFAGSGRRETSGSVGDGGARSYSGTLIRRSGNVSYQHDGQGRTTVRSRKRICRKPEVWHFAYDCGDRMVAASTADVRWIYAYDAFGRRISKQRMDADGRPVEGFVFSWDGDRLIEQTHTVGSGPGVTTSWDYLPGTWTPVAQRIRRTPADSEFYAIVSDMIGRPTSLVTSDGARVAWRHGDSTLWGAPRRDAESSSNVSTRYDIDCPIRFPGQYADDETGLHYNRHRYYDPESARYTTRDPLGLAPGPDPHGYVPNPTSWADPLGLAPCDPANLRWDEANGGHTIARHVAKSIIISDLAEESQGIVHFPIYMWPRRKRPRI